MYLPKGSTIREVIPIFTDPCPQALQVLMCRRSSSLLSTDGLWSIFKSSLDCVKTVSKPNSLGALDSRLVTCHIRHGMSNP